MEVEDVAFVQPFDRFVPQVPGKPVEALDTEQAKQPPVAAPASGRKAAGAGCYGGGGGSEVGVGASGTSITRPHRGHSSRPASKASAKRLEAASRPAPTG